MNYTLHQLKVFLKVVELKSITKASEALYLTQPAVSIQIKKLQDQFELPLTEVIGKQLYITEFGKVLATKCEKIIEAADEIKDTVSQYKGVVTGKLKISVVSTGKYVIPFFIKPFMDLYPEVEISVNVSNKNRVIKDLQNNATDFALVSIIPEGLKLKKIELMENKLYFASKNTAVNRLQTPKDLEKVNLLFRESGSATRDVMEQYLKEHNVQVKNAMELVSNEAIKQAIYADVGCSLMPIIGLRLALKNKEIKVHKLEGLPMVTKWNLVYLSEKKLTTAHQAFINTIRQKKEELIHEHFNWSLEY
ncbi:LysR family transcriptional regulator [Ochrovirga pacifica]|uniref:LysR family transcriptional regulator n=1 Tax=Ochrovirga pacifica TaxID=1042376 RepID=UPI000496FC2A|nr:LysR family transcriptional regulator [Ochrovirga pacifica]